MRKDFQEKTSVSVENKHYMANKKWRLSHPSMRYAQTKRNRHKTINALNSYKKWTSEDENIIMTSRLTDTEISKLINRSVQAIQGKRHKLMKLMEVNN